MPIPASTFCRLPWASEPRFSSPSTGPVHKLQVEDLDAIVVPVSGGGMVSGVATAAKGLRPGVLIVAAEPTGDAVRPRMQQSLLS